MSKRFAIRTRPPKALFEFLTELSFFAEDRKGRFVALNGRGCEHCGVPSEAEAIGKTDYDFFPKSRADDYRADDFAVMELGEAIVDHIESEPIDAGSPRLVMTSKVPLRDQRGRVIRVAEFSRRIDRIQSPSGTVDAFANANAHLHEHFTERMLSEELTRMAGLSVSHFERQLRRAFGASPRQYLLRIRVEHGTRLLRETSKTVSEIAHRCRFDDHARFSRSFRRIMKRSPSEYRAGQSHVWQRNGLQHACQLRETFGNLATLLAIAGGGLLVVGLLFGCRHGRGGIAGDHLIGFGTAANDKTG